MKQRGDMQAAFVQRGRKEQHVKRAFTQPRKQISRRALANIEFQLRILRMERRNDERQEIRPEGPDYANAHGSGKRVGCGSGQRRDVSHVAQHDACPSRHFGTNGSQGHTGTGPFDQLHPEFLFQFPQLGRQRRLRDMHIFSSTTEVQSLGDGNQITKLL